MTTDNIGESIEGLIRQTIKTQKFSHVFRVLEYSTGCSGDRAWTTIFVEQMNDDTKKTLKDIVTAVSIVYKVNLRIELYVKQEYPSKPSSKTKSAYACEHCDYQASDAVLLLQHQSTCERTDS